MMGVHTGKFCVKSHPFVPKSCEFRTNSREFTPMNRLQACRVLAPLVLGAVWAWGMVLGRNFHRMMPNEAGGRILPPQIHHREPKIRRPPKNLEIRVDSREFSRPIQTATYPPFTKGTWWFPMVVLGNVNPR